MTELRRFQTGFVIALLGVSLMALSGPAAASASDEGCTSGAFTEAGNTWVTANTLHAYDCTAALGQGEDWFKVDADAVGITAPLEAEACPDGFDLQLEVYRVSGGALLPDVPRIGGFGDGPQTDNINRLLLPFRAAEEDEADADDGKEDGCEQATVVSPLVEGTWYLRIDADTDALDHAAYELSVR